MKKPNIEIVRPANARGEKYGLLIALLVIVVAWAGLIHCRSHHEERVGLEAWQVGAFRDLNTAEQGLFGDLRVAAEEVHQAYLDQNGTWPRVDTLQAEGIAPFTQDKAWRNRGKIEWSDRLEDERGLDRIIYLGLRSDSGTTGSFLLEIHHHRQVDQDGPPYRVWHHPGRPESPTDVNWNSLVQTGWKEIVAYQGEDEVRRLKGIKQ
ncbi:DUF6162 family protein [Desulfomonile tiedjei]|uniref:Uncharacterized protein n=1 Tax=Desulfomonile tiedjei (strain ATCC 49306 / DSM 6799 / DCB-1) TaxID=706587 RepID=I4CCW6_DESTA|nr:DUF6162 family protein [Desulfomonile tiedjei]AFM27407.1 hypothetical protein Desti_4788 [Desulfomonile tiedjei DSM 6799]